MRIYFLFFCFCIHFVHAQEAIPEGYFDDPLEIPIVLSGTFGELRSNHFHSGVDIKTQGKTGASVFAVADGYIKRIKISHTGYGKALYIQHTNGYMSVYAHLKNLAPILDSYTRKRQYLKEKYEIEIYPKANELKIKKGQIIGYSGNTGSSGGPHLHFEIRDKYSRPMNPLLFGIDVKDTKKPIINSLWVYPKSDDIDAHVSNDKEKQKLRLILQKDGSYKTPTIEACGSIGFGVSTVDRQNMAPNKNGVYMISTEINGQKNFELEMKRFSFSETRYLNQHIDYAYYKNYKSKIRKLFVEDTDPLSIYKNVVDKGYLEITDGLSYIYTITIKDLAGNTSIIRVPIIGIESKQPSTVPTPVTTDFAKRNENFVWSKERFDLHIPKNALYKNTALNIAVSGDTISIHDKATALHKNLTLSIDVSHYNAKDRQSLYIAELNEYGKPEYTKTIKKKNRFTTKTRSFGKYTLAQDTIPPTIQPLNFKNKKWISNHRFLELKIKDKGTGIDTFKATINGKFILLEYDYKTGKLFYDFNDNIVNATENKFEFIVLDKVGNSTTFNAIFFRKNKT